MTPRQFHELLDQRWSEACLATGCSGRLLKYEFGEYPHFLTARGYAVTFYDGSTCLLRFARKILDADLDRIEGVMRHELGHVVDFLAPNLIHLGKLTKTAERRADDIAKAIWERTIYYDRDDVQTLKRGVSPRPKRLGL